MKPEFPSFTHANRHPSNSDQHLPLGKSSQQPAEEDGQGPAHGFSRVRSSLGMSPEVARPVCVWDLIKEKRWASKTRRWQLVPPRPGTCFPLLSGAHLLGSRSRLAGPDGGAGVKSSFSLLLVPAEGAGRSQKRGRFRLQLSSYPANELFIAGLPASQVSNAPKFFQILQIGMVFSPLHCAYSLLWLYVPFLPLLKYMTLGSLSPRLLHPYWVQ